MTNQEASSEVYNEPAGTNRPAGSSRCGCTKAWAYKGHARGRSAREETGDEVHGGEDVA